MPDFLRPLGDPLVIAVLLLAVGTLAARLLFKRHPMGRVASRLFFFGLLTLLLTHYAPGLPYEPLRSSGDSLHTGAVAALKIAWWGWGAWLLVGFLRSVLIFERRPREGKLLQDIIAGVIYLAAFFAIIANVFELPIQGLLATSGAIAIIIGLALQSTLGDVFSGLVLSFSRPYRVDDWIRLDGGTEGRVIEMNWRATQLLTSQHDLVVMPNSVIAKGKIVNVNSPNEVHGLTLSVVTAGNIPPATGIAVIHHAIVNARLTLPSPQPSILVKSIAADTITYEVTIFTANLSSASRAQNELFDLIYRHLAASGVRLALADGTAPAVEATHVESGAERALIETALFAALTKEERATLAKKLKRGLYDEGETLLKPGILLHSLYIVADGVLSVVLSGEQRDVEVLRLGPGDHYGEIALLTGAPSPGTITALTPAVVYELPKDDLAPILEARPQVAHELSRALARVQALRQKIAAAHDPSGEATPGGTRWFTERLQKLFNLRSDS
jgi:small-conductance mechanosensitive channel/CRP-like cAMP-binding protein